MVPLHQCTQLQLLSPVRAVSLDASCPFAPALEGGPAKPKFSHSTATANPGPPAAHPQPSSKLGSRPNNRRMAYPLNPQSERFHGIAENAHRMSHSWV